MWPIIFFLNEKSNNKNNLVGDTLSLHELVDSWVMLRLNSSFANVSNLAVTSGDFSDCSVSELSCSELVERIL